MNKGLFRSGPHDLREYGENEGLPLIDCSITSPVYGRSQGRYQVIDNIVFFHISIFDITNRGSGVVSFLAPPVKPWLSLGQDAGSGSIWLTMAEKPFGIKNATFEGAIVPGVLTSAKGIPPSRLISIFPSPTNNYSPPGGITTMTTGNAIKTVTHGLYQIPDNVLVTPVTDLRTASGQPDAPAWWWVDNITATTFDINCQTLGTSGNHFGTATVPNGSTLVTVNHHFGGAPTVNITPKAQPSTKGCVEYWVDNVGGTNFQINAVGTAGANLTAALSFDWLAKPGALETGVGVRANTSFAWHVMGPTNGTNAAGIYMTDDFPFLLTNLGACEIVGWYFVER